VAGEGNGRTLRRPRAHRLKRQRARKLAAQQGLLDLFGDEELQRTVSAQDRQLRQELEHFSDRLQLMLPRPLSRLTAAQRARVLARMVRLARASSVIELLLNPVAVVAAILDAKNRALRLQRHLVIQDAAEAFDIGEAAARTLRETLSAAFPGRTDGCSWYVNSDPRGDTKETRLRPPLTWLHLDVRIKAALRFGDRRGTGARDAALFALHLYSSMPPTVVASLTWDRWRSRKHIGADLWLLPWEGVRGFGGYLVHAKALEWVERLWVRSGSPNSGQMFVKARGGPGPLEPRSVGWIFPQVQRSVGLAVIDRRHLRIPFAVMLTDRNLFELKLSRSFGFNSTRAFNDWLRPGYEALMQIKGAELRPSMEEYRPALDEEPALAELNDAVAVRSARFYTAAGSQQQGSLPEC
jgi:hypothetical protein